MMTQEGEQLLTVEQVARRLNINPRTVNNMVRRGELQAFKVAGRLRFEPRTIEEYLRRHQVKPTDELPY